MLGYIGLGVLVIAYILLISKYKKYFVPVDVLAGTLLSIHAIMIGDIPFTAVNIIVTICLIIKFLQKDLEIK